MANRFSVEAVFRAVDRVTVPVSRMQNRIQKFTRRSSANFSKLNRAANKFGRGLRRGAMAATAALLITGAAMADIINVGAKFDQTLVNAAAKFPGEIRKGTDEFKALAVAAKEVGDITEFSATQAAEGLNFLAMAGFDAENSIAALPIVADLASAAAVDLGTATDIATDSLGAFNLLTKDAATNQKNLARVSDILAATSTSANTTIEDMFEALKQGAPVATAAGQSIETTAALIATMANAGIKGTKAGTGLKNIMLAFAAPGSAAAKIMKRLEIATTDASGNMRDAVDVFDDFSKAAGKLPEAQKLAAFKEIFGKIPIAAAVNLTNAAETTREFRDMLLDTDGAAARMANTMRNTVSGDIDKLKASIESTKISIFEMNEGAIRDVLQGMTAWIKANEKFIASGVDRFIQRIVDNKDDILLWAERIGKTALAITALVVALKTFVLIMTAVNLVMSLNPVVLIIGGIVLLIAAVVLMVRHWDTLREKFVELPLAAKIAIGTLFAPLALLAGAAKFIIDEWEPIKAFFGSIWDDIVEGVAMATEAFIKFSGLGLIGDAIGIIGSLGGDILGGLFGGNGDEQADTGASATRVVTPSERTARSIEESTTTNTSEVTIRDETGRASITGGSLGRGLSLLQSGDF